MININWNQVLTTVISTFLAAIIVGASAVVWKGANSVDEKVQIATENLEDTANYAKASVDLLDKELAVSRDREARLESKIDGLSDEIENLEDEIETLSASLYEIQNSFSSTNVFQKYAEETPEVPLKGILVEELILKDIEVPVAITKEPVIIYDTSMKDSFEYSPIQKRLPKLDLKR